MCLTAPNLRSLLCGSILGVALALMNSPICAQIVIDDAPLTQDEILAEVPIIGYRSFPKEALVALDPKKDQWAIDGAILYAAAANDPDLLAKAGKSAIDINSLSLQQLLELYKKFAGDDVPKCDQYGTFRVCQGSLGAGTVIHFKNTSRFYDTALDPQVVRLAFASDKGALKNSTVQTLPISNSSGSPALGVSIDAGYAKTANDLYGSVNKASGTSLNPSTAFAFSKTAEVTSKKLSEVTALLITKVDIGHPLVFPAKEKGLKIEPSISKAFDVYWLQMAINPREDLRSSLSELSFFVSLKTRDSEALDLVPLRFGQEVSTKEEHGPPEIKVEVEGTGVSVGKFYSQEITYKSLKPTIVGTGLQAAEFGWSLSDEMLDMSGKRLIAIIGVPKNARKLELQMVVSAKTKPQLWGAVQGNVGSSAPKLYGTDLHQ